MTGLNKWKLVKIFLYVTLLNIKYVYLYFCPWKIHKIIIYKIKKIILHVWNIFFSKIKMYEIFSC
jgi:hypothetical protein